MPISITKQNKIYLWLYDKRKITTNYILEKKKKNQMPSLGKRIQKSIQILGTNYIFFFFCSEVIDLCLVIYALIISTDI